MRLIDNNNRIYPSIREFCRQHPVSRTHMMEKLKRDGQYFNERLNLVAYIVDEDAMPEFEAKVEKVNPIFAKLQERYTDEELSLLCKGEGLKDISLDYPEYKFDGEKHKILVLSDTHIGSKYTPHEWIVDAIKEGEKQGCEMLLHAGDLVDGLCPNRIGTHIFELEDIGYRAQRDRAVELFSNCSMPMYFISGNHDAWYGSGTGVNIVEDFCDRLPNAYYLGHDSADVYFGDVIVRLHHGLDGNSYSKSYRLQKLAEAITGGKKPNIMLCGHVHKYCAVVERNIQMLSLPSMQMQTPWMRGKRIKGETGFIIMEFTINEYGIGSFKHEFIPFYG